MCNSNLNDDLGLFRAVKGLINMRLNLDIVALYLWNI